ncbi:MAG: hypothetical protein CMN55_00130 [Sneathiella sp.]|nr:hypothetical protein [Sneathiella sp.]
MAVGAVVSYVGAQREAQAQRMAAESAIAMGKYNAQVDVNNMVAEQNDIRYRESALTLKKNQELQKAEFGRQDLEKKNRRALAQARVSMPSFGGTYSDVLRSAEKASYDNLAKFDFATSQETAGLSGQIADTNRQLGYAYQRGMSNRDLTLRTAANTAVQFRNQASQTSLAGTASLFSGLGSAAAASQ